MSREEDKSNEEMKHLDWKRILNFDKFLGFTNYLIIGYKFRFGKEDEFEPTLGGTIGLYGLFFFLFPSLLNSSRLLNPIVPEGTMLTEANFAWLAIFNFIYFFPMSIICILLLTLITGNVNTRMFWVYVLQLTAIRGLLDCFSQIFGGYLCSDVKWKSPPLLIVFALWVLIFAWLILPLFRLARRHGLSKKASSLYSTVCLVLTWQIFSSLPSTSDLVFPESRRNCNTETMKKEYLKRYRPDLLDSRK